MEPSACSRGSSLLAEAEDTFPPSFTPSLLRIAELWLSVSRRGWTPTRSTVGPPPSLASALPGAALGSSSPTQMSSVANRRGRCDASDGRHSRITRKDKAWELLDGFPGPGDCCEDTDILQSVAEAATQGACSSSTGSILSGVRGLQCSGLRMSVVRRIVLMVSVGFTQN